MIIDFAAAAAARRERDGAISADFHRTALLLDAIRLLATANEALVHSAFSIERLDAGTIERLFLAFGKVTEAEGLTLNEDLQRLCAIADRVLEGLPE